MSLFQRNEDKKSKLEYTINVYAGLYNEKEATTEQRVQYVDYLREYVCSHETNIFKQRPYWDKFNQLVKEGVIKYDI